MIYIVVVTKKNEESIRLKKEEKKMCKIVHVAVYIVNECVEKKIPIDYFKTQKLSYFCQGVHLKKYDVPLAPEEVVNWGCGAAFKEIYAYFKNKGLSDKVIIDEKIEKNLDLLEFEKDTIDEVINRYAHLSFETIKELHRYNGMEIGDTVPIDVIKTAFNDRTLDN